MENKTYEDPLEAIPAKRIKQEPMEDPLATEDLEERKAFVDSKTQTETFEEANDETLKQRLNLLTNENKELKEQLLNLAAEEKSEISELKARIKQLNSRMFTKKTSQTIRRTHSIKNPDGSVTVTKTAINDPNQSYHQVMPSIPRVQPQLVQLQQPPYSQQNFQVGSMMQNTNCPNIVQEHPLNQRIQFVRSPLDGKIVVLGLLPGQQVVQMPDGGYQIISRPMGVLNPSLNRKE